MGLNLFARRLSSALVLVCGASTSFGQELGGRDPEAASAADAFARIPFHFEPAAGEPGRFVARGAGYTLLLEDGQATFAFKSAADASSAIHLRVVGGNASAPEGCDPLPSVSNYFLGDDPRQWRSSVPNYARVAYRSIHPGIDLVFHGDGRALEYDFLVAPLADPRRIELEFAGAERMELTAEGALVLHADGRTLTQQAPRLWQDVGAERREVRGSFVLRGNDRVAFDIGDYDATLPLVIDPTLVYGTFIGGSGLDWAWAIAVDSQGFAWLAGETDHASFPTTNGVADTSFNGGTDVFVCKLNPSGNTLVWSTFLGGTGNDRANAIAIDNAGLPYITGYTTSTGFPTTAGAFDTSQNGGTDVFVTKLSATGAMSRSAFLGGNGEDIGTDIAIDRTTGITFVTGTTTSNGFPVTAGGFDVTSNGGVDIFVTNLAATFGTLAFSTYVGGSGDDYSNDINLVSSQIPVVTGYTWSSNFPTPAGPTGPVGHSDVFAFRLAATGQSMSHAKVFGGSSNDWCWASTLDSQGTCYMAGATLSQNYPTTAGVHDTTHNGGAYGDIFITKLNPMLTTIALSTFVGGSGTETVTEIALDGAGRIIIVGGTDSTNFPTRNALDATHNGAFDAIVAVFNPTLSGQPAFSTYIGSNGMVHDACFGVGLDGVGIMYVAGYAGGTGFPTTMGAYDTSFNGGVRDAMALKISGY